MKWFIINVIAICVYSLRSTTLDGSLDMKKLRDTKSIDILKILNIDEMKLNKTIEYDIEEEEVLKHKSIFS